MLEKGMVSQQTVHGVNVYTALADKVETRDELHADIFEYIERF